MKSKILALAFLAIFISACNEGTTPIKTNDDESFNGTIKVEEDCGWSIVVDSIDLERFEKFHRPSKVGPINGEFVAVNLPDSFMKQNLRIKFISRLADTSANSRETQFCTTQGTGGSLPQIFILKISEQK